MALPHATLRFRCLDECSQNREATYSVFRVAKPAPLFAHPCKRNFAAKLVPSSDISLEPVAAVSRVRSLKMADVVRASLLGACFAMTWAMPLSPTLAINLFRVVVVLWLAQAFERRELPHSRIFLPLLSFFAIAAIASLAAQDHAASWQGMKVVELGFAAVIVGDSVRETGQLRFLVGGLLLTSVIAGFTAMWQVHSGAMLRAQGFYKHYINFGEMLLLVSLVCFGLLMESLRCARFQWKVLLAVSFTLLTAALAATATRTFLAALLFGCAVIIWMCFRWRVRAIAAAALLIAMIVGGWWLQSRRGMSWFDSGDPGTQYRFLIWKDAAHIIRAHPLLGVGFANVQRHPGRFDMLAYRKFPNMISHFHSTYIEIAADCGIPALVIWCWLIYSCWAAARRAFDIQRQKSWFGTGISLGALGAVAAFQLASLFHFILGDPEPMLIFWILIGSAIILEQQNKFLAPDPQ
jgi:O-antigen ligase